MASLGATASDVSRQLRRIQAEFPGGEARVGGLEQSVRTTGTIASPQELAALPIVLPDGRTCGSTRSPKCATRPRSSASSRCSTASRSSASKSSRAWGASALDVAEARRRRSTSCGSSTRNVTFKEVSSTVDFIRESYEASMEMLFEGALLAVIVVWVFLRDWRATFDLARSRCRSRSSRRSGR